jgi:DnaJ-class molecular chaperone
VAGRIGELGKGKEKMKKKCKRCQGKGYELKFTPDGIPLRVRCDLCRGSGKQPGWTVDKMPGKGI